MMAQRPQFDMFMKGRIVQMLKSSRSQTEVSQILNVDQSVISRLWQRFQRTRDVTRQLISRRPRVTTLRQNRYLVISARRQRSSTDRALGSTLTVATGIQFRDKLFTGDSIMLARIPEDQQFAFPSRLCINALV
ncbi:paired domain-containing protein [Trichonephila clavipes]|nr:paired domain-containing protein [Trichonephila clavipes]